MQRYVLFDSWYSLSQAQAHQVAVRSELSASDGEWRK